MKTIEMDEDKKDIKVNGMGSYAKVMPVVSEGINAYSIFIEIPFFHKESAEYILNKIKNLQEIK